MSVHPCWFSFGLQFDSCQNILTKADPCESVKELAGNWLWAFSCLSDTSGQSFEVLQKHEWCIFFPLDLGRTGGCRMHARPVQTPETIGHRWHVDIPRIVGGSTENYIMKMQLCDSSCTKLYFITGTDIFTSMLCTKIPILDNFD